MKWKYELKCSNELRNAIRNEDLVGVVIALQRGHRELLDEGLIDEWQFESYTRDLEECIEVLDADDGCFADHYEFLDADDIDYELSNFYDLCDNVGAWIAL